MRKMITDVPFLFLPRKKKIKNEPFPTKKPQTKLQNNPAKNKPTKNN